MYGMHLRKLRMGHQATSRKSDFHTVGWSPLAHSIQHPALLGKHRNILPRAWQNTQAQQLEYLCNKVPFFTPIPVLLLVHKHFWEVFCQHQASFPSWTDGFSPIQHCEREGVSTEQPLCHDSGKQLQGQAGNSSQETPSNQANNRKSPAVLGSSGEKQ